MISESGVSLGARFSKKGPIVKPRRGSNIIKRGGRGIIRV